MSRRVSTPYAITARYTSSIKGKGGTRSSAIVLPWSESLLARVYTARYKFYGRAIIGNLVNLLEEEFRLGINPNFYVDYLYSEQKQGYYFSEMIRSNGWRNV